MMKIPRAVPTTRPKLTEAEIAAAAWRALEKSSSEEGPHPKLEEWEDLVLGGEALSAERRTALEAHLAACDRCFVEVRQLTAFLAPISPWRRWRTAGQAAVLVLVGSVVLWAGIELNPLRFASTSVATSAQSSVLWLYPAGPTRSADSRRPPEIVLDQGRKYYDLKLLLDKKRQGLFRVVVARELEGERYREWSSPLLPIIESLEEGQGEVDPLKESDRSREVERAELPLRLPAHIFDARGSFLIELRKSNGGVIDVFPLKVVESPS